MSYKETGTFGVYTPGYNPDNALDNDEFDYELDYEDDESDYDFDDSDYEFGTLFSKKKTTPKSNSSKSAKITLSRNKPVNASKAKKVTLSRNKPVNASKAKKVTLSRNKPVNASKAKKVMVVNKQTGTARQVQGQTIQLENGQLQTIVSTRQLETLPTNPVSSSGSTLPNYSNQPIVMQNSRPSILDSLFGLSSQVVSGWSKNPTVQTANGQVPIYALPNNQSSNPSGGGINNSNIDYTRPGGAIETTAESIGGGLDGIFEWVKQNLGLVAIGTAAVFFLFREPPKYGNRR